MIPILQNKNAGKSIQQYLCIVSARYNLIHLALRYIVSMRYNPPMFAELTIKSPKDIK